METPRWFKNFRHRNESATTAADSKVEERIYADQFKQRFDELKGRNNALELHALGVDVESPDAEEQLNKVEILLNVIQTDIKWFRGMTDTNLPFKFRVELTDARNRI